MNKLRATYTGGQTDYEIAVDYTYYWDSGDWETPAHAELEVTAFYINDTEISINFYYEFVHDKLEDSIIEHAQGNK
jgi:hypothetical protein